MSNKEKYANIKDAAALVGKSQSTIRNLIGAMSSREREKYTTKKGRKILILKSFLESRYEVVENRDETVLALIRTFENQLNAKDKQIEKMGDFQVQLVNFLMDLGITKKEIQDNIKTYQIDEK